MRVVKRALDDIITCISTFDGQLPDAKGKMCFLLWSPAAIPLMIESIELFPDMQGDFLAAAETIGEIVWKKGL